MVDASLSDLAGVALSAVNAAGTAIGDIAGPYVNIYSASRQIGGIIPDVVLREVLSDTYTITNHPVESGTPISDHYFAQPRVVEISAGWSNSSGGEGWCVQVLQAFRALAATRETFTVDTGKASYDNMLIGEATTTTDAESENTLMMTIRLQEVIISQTSSTAASDPSTGSNANQAMPQTTGTPVNAGSQALLPYFASGTVPAGYTPASTGTGVGAAGIGGSPFNLTGGAR